MDNNNRDAPWSDPETVAEELDTLIQDRTVDLPLADYVEVMESMASRCAAAAAAARTDMREEGS